MNYFLASVFLLMSLSTWGQDFSIVAVGDATLEKDKLVVTAPFGVDALDSKKKNAANELVDIVRNDFSFYKKRFEVLKDYSRSVKTEGEPKYAHWKSKEVSLIVRLNAKKEGQVTNIVVEIYDVREEKLLDQFVEIIPEVKIRAKAHDLSDRIYRRLTGENSIFKSKIFFVSDRTGTKSKPQKELYSMDFDGKNIVQLTFHKGTVISPAISHDRSKILYSLIKNTRSKKRNINLYMLDLKTHKSIMISSKKGINSGAIFTHDDKNIILTLSHTGNADLYRMNLATRKLTKITRHYAADVDPSITRDGRLMTFLSDRPGKAMIYTLNPSGIEKNVRRISFVGQYNATPRFSPDGKEIVFSSWLDNRFDIFRIGAGGKGLARLTKDFGSNEDPTYSNDGQFIAFSSQRVFSQTRAVQNIYIMDRDGEILGQLTSNFGNCITPRWSK